jgi:hypothetical protein
VFYFWFAFVVGLSLYSCRSIGVAPVRGGTYFSLSLPKKSRQKKGASITHLFPVCHRRGMANHEVSPSHFTPRWSAHDLISRTVLPLAQQSFIRLALCARREVSLFFAWSGLRSTMGVQIVSSRHNEKRASNFRCPFSLPSHKSVTGSPARSRARADRIPPPVYPH